MKRSLPSIIAGAGLVIILGLYMVAYQVRLNEVAVVRTFGKIAPPQPGFLFAAACELPDELDDRNIPAALREEFNRHGIPLSDNAEIWTQRVDEQADPSVEHRWEVTDNLARYVIEKVRAQEDLNVSALATRDVKTKPGLYWKWPWPIQRRTILDNRLQMTETTGEETPTHDAKNVIVTTAIGWRIDDPYTFSIRNRDIKDAEEKLKTRVRNDQKTVIANYDFVNFVSTDTGELQYDRIEQEIHAAVVQSAKELYGIRVEYVGIARLALPKRITQNVFSAMKEERNAQAARYTSAGESEAAQIKADAENIAGTILAFADRKANEIVAEGKRRAAEYNRIFSEDEELAIFLLEIDYLKEILKDRATIILDPKPPFDLLGETEAGARSATQPAPQTPAAGGGPDVVDVPLPEIVAPK